MLQHTCKQEKIRRLVNILINSSFHVQADVRQKDILGREPLHVSSQAGCDKSVTFLIQKYGVPVDVTTSIGGLTPTHLAAKVSAI